MGPSPRLLVVEDEPTMARAVARFFDRRGWVTEIHGSLAAASRALAEHGPWDACVLDVTLADGSGLDLLDPLRAARPPVATLVLTSHTERMVLLEAQLASAHFLPKPPPADNLRAFAELVESARSAEPRRLAAVIEEATETFGLSPREAELLERFVRGTPRADLPQELGVAETTVRTLVRRLLTKTGHENLKRLAHHIHRRAFTDQGESDTTKVTR